MVYGSIYMKLKSRRKLIYVDWIQWLVLKGGEDWKASGGTDKLLYLDPGCKIHLALQFGYVYFTVCVS